MAALSAEELRRLKTYEEEIVDSLESSNLNKLSREAAEIGIISRNVKESFDSLDPSSVPRPSIKLRYLLLHTYEQLEASPRLYKRWLKVLAKHGVTSAVLGMPEGMDVTIAKNKGQGIALFSKEHISALTEILSSCWVKWRSIGISLNLPEQVRANIESKSSVWDIEVCLNKVLYEWIVGGHQHAKAPTLENLKKVLNSRTVGRGSEASQLEDNLKKHCIDITVKEFNAAVPSTTPEEPRSGNISTNAPSAENIRLDTPSIDIILLSLDTAVAEGKSTLLEVQAVSTCGGTISYQWMKDGCPLEEDEHYLGSNRNILCIKNAILASKGSYTCELKHCTEFALSNPIVVTVEVSAFAQVLIDKYCGQSSVPKDPWPPVGVKTYINLALVKQEKIDESSFYTIQGDMDDIMYRKKSIESDEVFEQHRNGAFLLIEGRPGSGKTTLVHKISKDWAQGRSILKGAKLVFLIHLRVLRRSDNILTDILKLFYRLHNDKFIEDLLEQIIKTNGDGVCFILDGLDEYDGDKEKSIVYELIQKDCLQQSMVIVSSRPNATAELRDSVDTGIEVVGFQEDKIFEYIKSYPFCGERKAEDLLSYLSQHPNILRICYLPVHAVMVSFLYDKMEDNLPHTECGIYTQFTMLMSLRKMGPSLRQPKSLDDLFSDKKEAFNDVCKLAFDMTIACKQVLEKSDRLSDTLGLVTLDFTAGLYYRQKVYSFVHLTFQEYLAAYYISKLEEEQQKEIIQVYGQMKHMRVVWKFYCGLANFGDSGGFEEILKLPHNRNSLFHCQCAFESQQTTTCESVVDFGGSELIFREQLLNFADFESIGYVIESGSPLEVLSLTHCVGSQISNLRACSEVLNLCGKLSKLDLSFNHIGNEGANILATGLKDCESLVYLNLSHNMIEELEALAQNFNCFSIKTLHLECNRITSDGVKSISDRLIQCSKLSELHLEHNRIGNEGAGFLSEGLRDCSNLSQLYLNHNRISDEGILSLVGGLKHCGKLSVLHLNHNKISDEGAIGLSESFKHFILHELHLEHNNISDKGAKGLADGLKQCSNLLVFYLNHNRIGDEGAKALAEGLKHCSKLTHLHFEHNLLKDEGAKSIAEVMKRCDKLSHLHFDHNAIGDTGLSELAKGLKYCNSISEVHLEHNRFGDEGAKSLGEGLKQCENLFEIYLEHNQIGNVGARGLGEGLQQCSNLAEIHLEHNQISEECVRELIEGFKLCNNITKVGLEHNNI